MTNRQKALLLKYALTLADHVVDDKPSFTPHEFHADLADVSMDEIVWWLGVWYIHCVEDEVGLDNDEITLSLRVGPPMAERVPQSQGDDA